MPKEFCISCGKPIENMDFYYAYPNGKICSACILKKEYGMEENSLLIGKQADKGKLAKQKFRAGLAPDWAVNN